MQLFCNKHFDWLDTQNLRHTNQRYPVANLRGPKHKKIYPYVYIQIYFHRSEFARILTAVWKFENKHIWLENIYIKNTLNWFKWGEYSSFTLSGSKIISCFPQKRNVIVRHHHWRRLTPIFIQRQRVNKEAKCNVFSKTEITALLNCQKEGFVIKCKL